MKFSTYVKLAATIGGSWFLASAVQAQTYQKTPNAAISGHNNGKISGTVQACIEACNNATGFVCKSFDYNKAARSCDLSDKSKDDVALKTTYPGNPYDYYHKPTSSAKSSTTGGMPDLSTAWDSTFGPIYWVGGYYGNSQKLLKGTLDKKGRIFTGKWGTMDNRQGPVFKGDVKFTFSQDLKSFTGTYVSTDGTKKAWNGTYKSGAPYSLGESQPIARDGGRYNAQLAFQIGADNSQAGQTFNNYGADVPTTSRCDAEIIAFFKGRGLSNGSITKFCR
ncbi:MAG: PAN/Apple domain-containing protein [Alphaproteobacteria bacterium]